MIFFIFFHKENRSANVIRFCIGTIQVKEFRKKIKFIFWPSFFTKKIIVFKWEQIKIKISLCFCFASTDSLKAVTSFFEKLEISAKRFGLKLNSSCSRTRVLNLSLHFKYQDVKSNFDRTTVWFDRFFFVMSKKKYSIWSGASLLQKIYWFDSINKQMNSGQTGWPGGSGVGLLIQYSLRAWVWITCLSIIF